MCFKNTLVKKGIGVIKSGKCFINAQNESKVHLKDRSNIDNQLINLPKWA